MLMYFSLLNWIFCMIFLFLNHPLSLGSILLIQSILISLMTGFMYLNYWFGYVLFLIMVGGMLVLFIYMTSIASNEKFKMPKNMIIFSMFAILMMMLMIFISDNFYSYLMNNMTINNNQSLKMEMLNLNKFFNYPNTKMMLVLMMYLLITLIASVKIIGKINSSLRQK